MLIGFFIGIVLLITLVIFAINPITRAVNNGIARHNEAVEKSRIKKEETERKAHAKAEAQAAGKSEKDVVNMYIILTNEKKRVQLHRSAEDFYDIYEEDFPKDIHRQSPSLYKSIHSNEGDFGKYNL